MITRFSAGKAKASTSPGARGSLGPEGRPTKRTCPGLPWEPSPEGLGYRWMTIQSAVGAALALLPQPDFAITGRLPLNRRHSCLGDAMVVLSRPSADADSTHHMSSALNGNPTSEDHDLAVVRSVDPKELLA